MLHSTNDRLAMCTTRMVAGGMYHTNVRLAMRITLTVVQAGQRQSF
ncbi:MAG: hypothetical protein JJU41_10630 [Bacteroidetes bacterium]|nr:hypothetical protein [Bacteroidota bacterium]